MVGCINRLWRVVIAALVISVAVSCGGRDLSHDPEAVDKVMVEYLLTDFGQDIKAVNSNVSEINKVKLTRQDANPIVIVDVVYKDGRSTDSHDIREFLAVYQRHDSTPQPKRSYRGKSTKNARY